MEIGLFVLIFITLPTIFLFFFKKKFLAKHPKFIKPWKIYRFFYIFFILVYIFFYILGTWHLNEVAKTKKAVDFINSEKITLDDVMGKNLPPIPDQKLNNSTISGIDANKNGIRDDVELAIFKNYPNSAKIRAAELQYAQALQLELTQVFNSETLVAVMKKQSRGIDCIGKTGPEDVSIKGLEIINGRKKEVEDLILNTNLRKNTELDNLNKYMVGYSSSSGNDCDIELSSLPN